MSHKPGSAQQLPVAAPERAALIRRAENRDSRRLGRAVHY